MNSEVRQLFGAWDVYQEAFKLYQKYIAGEPLTHQSFAALRQVIGTKEKYAGKTDHSAGYDGIFYG